MSITRVTMNMRSDAITKLEGIGDVFNQPTKTGANAVAIDLTSYLAEQLKAGQTLMLKDKDGSLRELVIPGVSR